MPKWTQIAAHVGDVVKPEQSSRTEPSRQVVPDFTSDLFGNAWRLYKDTITVLPSAASAEIDVAPPQNCTCLHSLQADFSGFIWLLADSEDIPGGLYALDPRGPGYTDDGLAHRTDPGDHSVRCVGKWHGDSARSTKWFRAELQDEVVNLEMPLGVGRFVCVTFRSGDRGCVSYKSIRKSSLAVDVRSIEDPGDADANAWKLFGHPMPCGIQHIQPCLLGRFVYVAGGSSWWRGYPAEAHVFDDLLALNLDDGKWCIVSKLPEKRAAAGMCAVGKLIFIIGGCSSQNGLPYERTDERQVWIFDTEAGTWSNGPELWTARQECACAALQGRVYVFGWGASVVSLAPGEEEWRQEPPCPFHVGGWLPPNQQFSLAVLDGAAYLAGPFGLLAFTPMPDGSWGGQWKEMYPLPASCGAAPLMCAHKGRILLIGGFVKDPLPGRMSESERGVRAFDPKKKSWEELPAFPVDLSWGGAVSVDDQVLAIGGAAWCPKAKTFLCNNRVFGLLLPGPEVEDVEGWELVEHDAGYQKQTNS